LRLSITIIESRQTIKINIGKENRSKRKIRSKVNQFKNFS